MGLLPLLLVICGGVLAVYGGNRWLEARTAELERPGQPGTNPVGRAGRAGGAGRAGRRPGALAMRLGGMVAAAGLILLAIDIVLHTVLAILSLVLTVVVVVAVIALLGRLLGGRRSKSG